MSCCTHQECQQSVYAEWAVCHYQHVNVYTPRPNTDRVWAATVSGDIYVPRPRSLNHHRSVAMAEEAARQLRHEGIGVEVHHRDIDKPLIGN